MIAPRQRGVALISVLLVMSLALAIIGAVLHSHRLLLQSSAQQLSLSRQSGLVPSRVADHLFWLGRYNERLNLICRALRSALPLIARLLPRRLLGWVLRKRFGLLRPL